MPSFPWPMRQDESTMTDDALAALLAGKESPADSVTGLQPVAEVLAALRAAATGEELAGEASALTAFRQTGVSAQTQRSHHRRRPLLTSLLRARVAATALAAILGAAATAAYANALPAPIQRLAHDVIGAPAAPADRPAGAHPAPSGTPVGPEATGPAAFGLCTAFAHAKEHGTATQRAVAFRNLAAAAGGASKVAAFCAAVPHPGEGSPSPHPTGKPTGHGREGPAAHPTPHPTGKPTAHPTPHPTGIPTSHPTGKPTAHR